MRRTRIEHMLAGLPPITDIARRDWDGRKVRTDIEGSFRQSHPITLEHLPLPSLHTDVGPLYHLAPSLRFRGDEGRCLLGGTEYRRKALLSETLAVFRG
jgi:hypothetical protein